MRPLHLLLILSSSLAWGGMAHSQTTGELDRVRRFSASPSLERPELRFGLHSFGVTGPGPSAADRTQNSGLQGRRNATADENTAAQYPDFDQMFCARTGC
jgi:hypothetical protein